MAELSITDIVPSPMFVIYVLFVVGLTAIPYGILPTFIVEEIVFVIPSITETVPDSILVTYAKLKKDLLRYLRGFCLQIRQ